MIICVSKLSAYDVAYLHKQLPVFSLVEKTLFPHEKSSLVSSEVQVPFAQGKGMPNVQFC